MTIEDFTVSHSELYTVLMMEAQATESSEDLPEVRKEIIKMVGMLDENQAKLSFMLEILSDKELETVEDEARTMMGSDLDTINYDARLEQLSEELLVKMYNKGTDNE